jgi:hypothetical protein
MKTCRHTCALLILLGSSLALSSASGQTSKLTKFDDFGYLNHENYSGHLDSIAAALGNEPNAQGYFIFYNGGKSLPGASLRYVKRLQNYLVRVRGIDPSRMILLPGGRREEMMVEFWFSPPGGLAPSPNPAALVEPPKARSYLYDRYSYDCDPSFQPKPKAPDYFDECGYAGAGYEDQSARLDGFIKAIRQTPGATAHLRVYFLPRDSRRKVQTFIRREKAYLLREGGLRASSIAVTSRTNPRRSVQLWVASGSDY